MSAREAKTTHATALSEMIKTQGEQNQHEAALDSVQEESRSSRRVWQSDEVLMVQAFKIQGFYETQGWVANIVSAVHGESQYSRTFRTVLNVIVT